MSTQSARWHLLLLPQPNLNLVHHQIKYDPDENIDIQEFKLEPQCGFTSSSQCGADTISGRTEIKYDPDENIYIQEFKLEPPDITTEDLEINSSIHSKLEKPKLTKKTAKKHRPKHGPDLRSDCLASGDGRG